MKSQTIKEIKKQFKETVKNSDKVVTSDEAFMLGCYAIKEHIESFVKRQLKGSRGDAFSKGQDDGLAWVIDELEHVFKPNSF